MPDSRPASLALLGGEPAVRIPSPHFRWPLIGAEEEEAVLNQLRSGQLSIPRRCGVIEEFEANFAAFHGLPYSLSTGSGTAALHAAYFGLGLEPGDEVLAPAYTHLGTVLPMLQLGLIPVLCDVEEETGNLDPSEIENRLSPRTRALAITHQYGHISDMEAIIAAAKRHNLSILEDCSHAHGATDYGKLAGTFGDVACFSLQAYKVISAGEGGILVTKDPRIFERAALLGHFRERRSTTTDADLPFVETGYGLKNRFHPLAAAFPPHPKGRGFLRAPATFAGMTSAGSWFMEELTACAALRRPGLCPALASVLSTAGLYTKTYALYPRVRVVSVVKKFSSEVL